MTFFLATTIFFSFHHTYCPANVSLIFLLVCTKYHESNDMEPLPDTKTHCQLAYQSQSQNCATFTSNIGYMTVYARSVDS